MTIMATATAAVTWYDYTSVVTINMIVTSAFIYLYRNKCNVGSIASKADGAIPSSMTMVSIVHSIVVILLTAILYVRDDTTLTKVHLLLFVTQAVSCLFVNYHIYIEILYHILTTLSYTGLYHMFIYSNSGYLYELLLSIPWTLSFLSLTSLLIRGSFTSTYTYQLYSPNYLYGCSVAYLLLYIVLPHPVGSSFDIPVRLAENDGTEFILYHSISCFIYCLCLFILITIEEDERQNEMLEASPSDAQSTGNKQPHVTTAGELPADCVEVDMAAAIELVDGRDNKLRQRRR